MYPPIKRRDPIADWLGERRGVAPEAEPLETEVALQDTVFTDPVKGWLLTRKSTDTLSPGIQKTHAIADRVFGPMEWLTKKAQSFGQSMMPTGDASEETRVPLPAPFGGFNPTIRELKAFAGGSTEAAANMATPFNLATMAAAPVTRLPGAVGSLARMAEAGGGAFEVGQGLAGTQDAISRGAWKEAIAQGGLTAFGALGVGLGALGPSTPTRAPYDAVPRVRDSGIPGNLEPRNVRPDGPGPIIEGELVPPNAPRRGATDLLLERGDPQLGLQETGGGPFDMPPSPTMPRGPMDLELPSLRNQFADAVVSGDMDTANALAGELRRRGFPLQQLLPESTAGPILTPPPQGSLPDAPPRYGADVRWQHPASPSAGPVAGVGPASSQAPAPAAPSGPAAFFSPDEIAALKKQGFDDATIALLASRGSVSTPPDPRTVGGSIAPDPIVSQLPPLSERMAASRARSAPPTETAPVAPEPPVNIGRSGEEGDPLSKLLGLVEEAKLTDPTRALDDMLADPNVDALTSTMNRRGWERSGDGAPKAGRVIGRIDVDNFKTVNDTLGHAEGDRALQVISDALGQFARRRGDRVARVGGDEFALDLEAPGDPAAATALREAVEQRVNTALRDAGFPEDVGISLGLGADEAAADAAAMARKTERNISRPRAGIDAGPPPVVESAQAPNVLESPAPLAGPASTGDLLPAAQGDVPVRGRRQRVAGARNDSIAGRAEARWPELLADARAQGFTGTDAELRASFDDAVSSARSFIDDMGDIADEDDIFALIREQGGLDPSYFNIGGKRTDEMNELRELLDKAGMRGRNSIIRTGAGANQQANAVMKRVHAKLSEAQRNHAAGKITDAELAAVKEEASRAATTPVGTRRAGMSVDDLATFFKESHPRFGINSDWDLVDELRNRLIDKIEGRDKHAADYDFEDVLENAVGVKPGAKWWDKADTSFDPKEFDPVAGLEPDPSNPAYAKVPFPVADDATLQQLPGRIDYDKPTLERVSLSDLIATQPTVTRDVVAGKIGRQRTELAELPVGVYGRAPRDPGVPVVYRDSDTGELYLGDGTHDSIAAMLDGAEDIQAIVYPTKPKAAADPLADILDAPEPKRATPGVNEQIPGLHATATDAFAALQRGDKLGLSITQSQVENAFSRGLIDSPEGVARFADMPMGSYEGMLKRMNDGLIDVVDGEIQPRLPEAGGVRDNELAAPEFEAPFALDRQVDSTPQGKQTGLLEALGATPKGDDAVAPMAPVGAKPGASDATGLVRPAESSPDFPEPRHEVKNTETVERLAASMRENGWVGRPALIVREGDTRVAWTSTHRLAAAKAAGLKPSDVPMVEVDGAALRAAGYDLDDLTAKGKNKRIEALRAIGNEEAAKLLEAEKAGSPERLDPPAGAADVEPVPENVREFLTRQLHYSPAEVDALGAKGAIALGNKVRMHPEGVSAGIAEFAKPKPPAYRSTDPGPHLGEGSPRVEGDELAKLLGIQERRTALQKTRVEPGEGTPATPKPTAAAVNRALTMKGESEAAIAAAKAGPAPVKSQADVARAKADMVHDARKRAKLLETPTPENLDEYMRLMGDAADRQAKREFKGGTSKDDTVKKHDRTGEYLASGLGGFEKLYKENPALFWGALRTSGGALVGALATGEDSPFGDDPLIGALMGAAAGAAGPRLWKTLAAKAPTATKALRDLVPHSIGGPKGGAPRGQVSPVRAPRDLTKDISGLEKFFGQPHRTVPDVWRDISPVLDELAEAEKGLPSKSPRMFEFTRQMYLQEAIGTIQHAAKQAKDQGLHRRAQYLDEMVSELKGTPAAIEKFVADLSGGNIKPKDVAKALARAEKALYTKFLGFALDTAIINRTQIGLAVPHIGVEGVLKGMKQARTPEGKAATRFLDIEDPVDAPRVPGGRVKPSLLRKVVNTALSPLRASDVKNRKDVYLGAMYHARKQGLDARQAHEWAMEITAQTQGQPGELGSNPFHRHLGPARMFTKYPTIWAQWFADIVSHPDPAVRRRGAAYMLGVPLAGAAAGINAMSFLIPRLMLTIPAAAGALELASHIPGLNEVTGKADHELKDDLTLEGVARYPGKVVKEVKDVARYGFGEHPEFDKSGSPRGSHSAWEGFMSLLGVESSRKADVSGAREEAYQFIEDTTRRRDLEGRRAKTDLRDAIEGGEPRDAIEAVRRLTPQQVREFYRRNGKTPYHLLLERVPKKDRPEFERRFRARLNPAESDIRGSHR